MQALISEHPSLIVFLALAAGKGAVELYAYTRQNRRGGVQSGKSFSLFAMVMGALMPALILVEIVAFDHTVPPPVTIVSIAVFALLLALRVVAVTTLGRFYSINIRIVDDHRLMTRGIYRYLRHPIYLIALVDNLVYPLACGAYVTAALAVLLGTPAILLRRAQEERLLLGKFGDEYEQYRRRTWF